jgi:hypothetical protein
LTRAAAGPLQKKERDEVRRATTGPMAHLLGAD